MNKYWILRQEIYRSLHRWPSMMAFVTLGCLLGWVISYIWPSYYRSTSLLYIGLNPYRTYSDTAFLALEKPHYANIDNYLYWQMYQLETVIFLDDFIQETLDDLRQSDVYWNSIEASQLRDMLDAEWRTAGEWSLVAMHPDSERAKQAVQIWTKVVKKRVQEAIQAARNTFMIDQELQAAAVELLQSRLQEQELLFTKSALREWSIAATKLPKDQPLDPAERWHVFYLATLPAQFHPIWQIVLENQPPANSTPNTYLDWIAQIIPIIDSELSTFQKQIGSLEQEYSRLEELYSPEADRSLGLSPNLEVEKVKDLPPKMIRATSVLILIGGIAGLLIWILTQWVIITNREENQ